MRLIDADKLRKDVIDLPNIYNGFSDTYDKSYILDLVDEQPTVDAEPTRHGHWIPYEFATDYRWRKCSVCGTADEYINNLGLEAIRRYCPFCGAKMDEEANDDIR